VIGKSLELSPERGAILAGFDRAALASRIKADIDAACVRLYQETEPRTHLGASVVGQECTRRVWYGFRWFKRAVFEARMLRLFNRGHREEERFVAWAREAGFNIWEVDPETDKQFRVYACAGHFGGSLDGIAKLPYPELNGMSFLTEFKTHNAKSFAKLQKLGVRGSKPQHFKQMCTYGKAYEFRYSIYFAVNKDTDDLHIEVVELDWSLGDDMTARGFDVINARVPPAKIAMRSDFWECKHCEFRRVCWFEEPPEKQLPELCERVSRGRRGMVLRSLSEQHPERLYPARLRQLFAARLNAITMVSRRSDYVAVRLFRFE
jgi:hypothetical protein